MDDVDPRGIDREEAQDVGSRLLDTAMIASASSIAVRSIQVDRWYALPNCSTFHGRSGSSECVVRTSGTPHSFFAMNPAMSAYHVWQWTTSASRVSLAIDRSRWKASSAPLNRASVSCVAAAHGP